MAAVAAMRVQWDHVLSLATGPWHVLELPPYHQQLPVLPPTGRGPLRTHRELYLGGASLGNEELGWRGCQTPVMGIGVQLEGGPAADAETDPTPQVRMGRRILLS